MLPSPWNFHDISGCTGDYVIMYACIWGWVIDETHCDQNVQCYDIALLLFTSEDLCWQCQRAFKSDQQMNLIFSIYLRAENFQSLSTFYGSGSKMVPPLIYNADNCAKYTRKNKLDKHYNFWNVGVFTINNNYREIITDQKIFIFFSVQFPESNYAVIMSGDKSSHRIKSQTLYLQRSVRPRIFSEMSRKFRRKFTGLWSSVISLTDSLFCKFHTRTWWPHQFPAKISHSNFEIDRLQLNLQRVTHRSVLTSRNDLVVIVLETAYFSIMSYEYRGRWSWRLSIINFDSSVTATSDNHVTCQNQ